MKNPLRRMSVVDKPEEGHFYLKVKCRIIHNYHDFDDGYCSWYDLNEESLSQKVTIETMYFPVPECVQEEMTSDLLAGTYDSEGLVNRDHEAVECLFEEMIMRGTCPGNPFCASHRIYIPLTIEYVEIVA